MEHICEFCHNTFESNWPAAKFCSPAHKQAAYRARIKAEQEKPDTFGSPAPIDDRTPVEKAIETKKNEQRFKTCPHCWNAFPVNGLQKARRYCSDACKQAAYRERHGLLRTTYHSFDTQAPTENIPVIDNLYKIVTEAWSDALDD
jgi:hypothetical protein